LRSNGHKGEEENSVCVLISLFYCFRNGNRNYETAAAILFHVTTFAAPPSTTTLFSSFSFFSSSSFPITNDCMSSSKCVGTIKGLHHSEEIRWRVYCPPTVSFSHSLLRTHYTKAELEAKRIYGDVLLVYTNTHEV